MASDKFWIVYDILTVALIAGTVFASVKKGFSAVIVSSCGYLFSCVAAAAVSSAAASQIYIVTVKDSITENIVQAAEKLSICGEIQGYISDMTIGLDVKEKDIEKIILSSDENNLDIKMYNLINAYSSGAVSSESEVTEGLLSGLDESMEKFFDGYIPMSFTKGMRNFTSADKEQAFSLIKVLSYDDKSEMAEYIEENYIRQYATELVKIFLFIIILFILMFIIKMIESSVRITDSLSGIKMNGFLGGVAGIIESCAFVYILCILIKILMLLTDDIPFFNETIIEQTKLFRLFYNFDIFD